MPEGICQKHGNRNHEHEQGTAQQIREKRLYLREGTFMWFCRTDLSALSTGCR